MKKTLLIAIFFSSLLSSYTIYDFRDLEKDRLADALAKGEYTTEGVKSQLDSMTNQVRVSANNLVAQLAKIEYGEKIIEQIIKNEMVQMPYINGISIAFEPYVFKSNQRLFALYVKDVDSSAIRLDKIYDYTNDTIESAAWYTGSHASEKPVISRPYFGFAADQLVLDYSVPFFETSEGKKKVKGVISISVAPNDFTEYISRFVQGSSGYLYLTNGDGQIITHPNRNFILHHRALDFAYSDNEEHKAEFLIDNPKGHFDYESPYTGVTSILFFDTIELTNWKIAAVYSKADLLGNPRVLERKIFHMAMAISLFLLFLVVYVFGLHKGSTKNLWNISISLTIIFLINIVLIWAVQLQIDYSEELENRTRIYSNSALSSFVEKKNYDRRLLGQDDFQLIPTGVFIDELVVTDSYNMSVIGKIWQKWPAEHDLNDNLGFEFTQASPIGRSVIYELQSRDKLADGTMLYTWKFNTTLRIFFDYNQFPIDQHYIDIKLRYPDITEDIMLVPDFTSYEVLNPSARPGLSDDIFLPKHRIIASYFSFSSLDLKTFFGQNREQVSPESETLAYNIVVKRRFITPFISFVIPFILGASIIFFLLYSLSKDEDDKSGVTVMGVVQGMAALFFSMLLAHITIRNRIPTPSVTYMEAYYFIIYVLIALLILIVVMYSRSDRYGILNYRDNLIAKISYWPALTGMLYIITLLKFY